MGSRWMRNTFIYLLIVVAVVAIVWSFLGNKPSNTQPKDISDVVALVQSGQVENIDVSGDNLTVHVKDDSTAYKARKEGGVSIYEILNNAGVSNAQIQAAHIKVASPKQAGELASFPVSIGAIHSPGGGFSSLSCARRRALTPRR